jgi:tRNA U34 5-methylaminomethyl-2-thiouridine-forming methyltransferase MnmC
MKVEAILCEDGSHTLFVPEMNETYHSRKGAITESEYVYIQAGLAAVKQQEIRILEFGFGTGLNALLSLRYAREKDLRLFYTTVELHPLSPEILNQLNYSASLGMADEWKALHQAEWNKQVPLEGNFELLKFQGDFRQAPCSKESIDLIYYDAFAPSKQPEVWTEEYLRTASYVLRNEGILVSYCAQGQFKRTLKNLGFEVEELPGPPGKMEMVRAIKRG